MDKTTKRLVYVISLIPLCILINFLGVKIAYSLELPLFLDSVGTIIAAILGGYLPGIIVGFSSNVINGLVDPITVYYCIVSIFIAILSAYAVSQDWHKRIAGALKFWVMLFLIGGLLGSVLTWMLYGGGIGTGISAPYAQYLYEKLNILPFFAQVFADIIIDAGDKAVTVILVWVAIKLFSRACPELCSMSFYKEHKKLRSIIEARGRVIRHSLKTEVALILLMTAIVLGTVSTAISLNIYRSYVKSDYLQTCDSAIKLMEHQLDGEQMKQWIQYGVEDTEYILTKRNLMSIMDSIPDITYMYVYDVRPDCSFVVFDLDTPDLPGERLGTIIDNDEGFSEYMPTLLAGEDIEPVVMDGSYGYLMTVYKSIKDDAGNHVAYAAVDVEVGTLVTETLTFAAKLISLLASATAAITVLAMRIEEKRVVNPIDRMSDAAMSFAYDSSLDLKAGTDRIMSLDIDTGNELDGLYDSICHTVEEFMNHIEVIDGLQSGIITSFGSLVESRDLCTGQHIKHTSGYVGTIARAMQKNPAYEKLLTDGYVLNLEKSAPLHDVGKIKIPDSVLNKPGKLTAEEFDIMKAHTTFGRDIINSMIDRSGDGRFLVEALQMATWHHERWDGSGYPDGLHGKQIPVSARIMAVADVFDALISKRSYKEPFSFDQARDIIVEESGTHFDPDVVNAFLDCFEDIKKLSE